MGLTNFPNGVTSFGSVVHGGSAPVAGREFYVRQTTDTGYAAWEKEMRHTVRGGGNAVHTTIESALAAAADWDTIWVYPGFYEPAADLDISQRGLRLLAVQTGPIMSMSSTMIYACGTAACTPVINVAASNVEIAGFRIYPYLGSTAVGISLAPTVSAYGSWIHDNIFYVVPEGMDGNMPVNIQMGTGAFDSAYSLIENNYFFTGGNRTTTKGMINWTLATRSMVRNNYFNIIGNFATQSAIHIESAAGPRGWILDNRFFGAEIEVETMAAYGILFDDTPEGGDYMVDGNSSVNLVAMSNNTGDMQNGLNYVNGTAV
jgi:hypothetical protein